MKITAYKYQGLGNDFVMLDNMKGRIRLTERTIKSLCDRRFGIGSDGLIVLSPSEAKDFTMEFYNSDGSGGMMCGNGGRCLICFADMLGVTHKVCPDSAVYVFDAPDGEHSGEVIDYLGQGDAVARLTINDVHGYKKYDDGWLFDTGAPHFVKFVSDIENLDIMLHGRVLRYDRRFEGGTNVNFVEKIGETLRIRTYERGVEAETWACGTGSTAAAIAAYLSGIKPAFQQDGVTGYNMMTDGGPLTVFFEPAGEDNFTGIEIVGPATFVFKTTVNI